MSAFCSCKQSDKTGWISIEHCNICGKIEQEEEMWFNPPHDMELIERAFLAGRSKTSWEQFKIDNQLDNETIQTN